MHELTLAQNIITIVREEMAKHDATILSSLRLAVGRMSGVVPESLVYSLGLITQGTDLEGVRVDLDIIHLRGVCAVCQQEFELQQLSVTCPFCQNMDTDIIAGRELSIIELEVE